AVLWSRSGVEERLRLRSATTARVVVGGLLVLAGVAVFLATNDAIVAARQVAIAVVVTVAGLALMLGPWIKRLVEDLAVERRARIRSEERADMAAHLHDSVLQTLALIQRNADRPRELVALARRQERELRSW